MRPVPIKIRALDDYRGIVDDQLLESIAQLAEPLQDTRVLHINSTPFGGGVAEMLASLVPLMRDIGLDAHWMTIEGDADFFTITKTLYNGLQGGDVNLTDEMMARYLDVNRNNALELEDGWDFVIVHDPQPAALAEFAKRSGRWIWRSHIDTSSPNEECLAFITRFMRHYDAFIVSMAGYVPQSIPKPLPQESCSKEAVRPLKAPFTRVIHPSIDPLSPKNLPIPPERVRAIASRYGVEPERPIMSSVARFDPWKDPLGVIDLYRLVKKEVPDLQLLMIASMAHDDPEGWCFYEKTLRRAGEDPDIFFLTNLRGVGNWEVNAFQRCSDVALLKSIREGFGLVASESLWKRVPVVGTRVGGIPLQVLDGKTGFLVGNPGEGRDRIVRLLREPTIRARLGEAGREHVRAKFLIPRHLRDYLALFTSLQQVA